VEEEEVKPPSGNSSYVEEDKEDDGVSSNEVEGNRVQPVIPSTPVSKGVISLEYYTPIVALLEGQSQIGALKKKKKKENKKGTVTISGDNTVNVALNEGNYFVCVSYVFLFQNLICFLSPFFEIECLFSNYRQ
jgi:hypothetical protein